MLKRITLKAIEQKIGPVDYCAISDDQAFLLVYGATEWLSDQALSKGTNVTQTESPSQVALRKLAKKITTQNR